MYLHFIVFWNYFLEESSETVLGKSESEFNKESFMTGVFKLSLLVDESKDIGVFGIVQSADAIIRSFRSYVFGDKHDTIWLSEVTFSPFLTEI